MADRSTSQLTYVVRLWREGRDAPWRALAQSAMTGERVYFAAAAEVCDFLLTAMGLSPPTSPLGGETHQDQVDNS